MRPSLFGSQKTSAHYITQLESAETLDTFVSLLCLESATLPPATQRLFRSLEKKFTKEAVVEYLSALPPDSALVVSPAQVVRVLNVEDSPLCQFLNTPRKTLGCPDMHDGPWLALRKGLHLPREFEEADATKSEHQLALVASSIAESRKVGGECYTDQINGMLAQQLMDIAARGPGELLATLVAMPADRVARIHKSHWKALTRIVSKDTLINAIELIAPAYHAAAPARLSKEAIIESLDKGEISGLVQFFNAKRKMIGTPTVHKDSWKTLRTVLGLTHGFGIDDTGFNDYQLSLRASSEQEKAFKRGTPYSLQLHELTTAVDNAMLEQRKAAQRDPKLQALVAKMTTAEKPRFMRPAQRDDTPVEYEMTPPKSPKATTSSRLKPQTLTPNKRGRDDSEEVSTPPQPTSEKTGLTSPLRKHSILTNTRRASPEQADGLELTPLPLPELDAEPPAVRKRRTASPSQ